MYVYHPAQIPVFVLAWLLIVKERWSFMPVGRTAGSMIMAVVTVVVQTLEPEEAFLAIEYGTLALLWGMMVLVEYLKDDALFDMFINKFFINNKNLSPTKLLWLLSMTDACMSALFTNDTMCIALTKTICYVCTQRGYHPGPQMVMIAMAANVGSAATLIGNPQNAIIAALSGVPFAKFLAYSFPAMLVCIFINTFALALWYKSDLAENTAFAAAAKEKMAEAGVYGGDGAENTPLIGDSKDELDSYVDTEGNKICCLGPFKKETNRKLFRYCLLLTITLTLAAFLANLDIGWVAAGGGCFAMFLDAVINHKSPERIFARVNWELLVFFSGLFIVIEGLQQTMIPGQLLDHLEAAMNVETVAGVCAFTVIITVGCNIFNNVPLTLLVGLAYSDCYVDPETGESVCEAFMESIGDPDLAWILLAWVATVSGNLTLMGSVANLIVAEEGKHYFEMSFTYYSKFGFPITIVTLFVGVAIICGLYNVTN
uniref:Low silicon 2-like 2 n=1 Tax=Didymoeca costata TaxID=459534 RepID=A0A1D8RAE7_9EUKA|nr:low silicon 2-like 2 [Didymoeca costata]|eukprot:m.331007 g.331007  ORF g.331007 m.331007 type:complete len:485 (+) comp16624_c0_seq1:108-1562(+)